MAGIIERNVGNLHDQDTGLLVGYRNPVTGREAAFQLSSGRALRAAAIGDSRMAQALQNLSTATQRRVNWSNQGALHWLCFLSYQAMEFPWQNVLAVSGATTLQIAGQVDAVLDLNPRPQLCFVNGGTNSIGANQTYAQALASFADITGAALRLMQYGIIPVIEGDAPRTVASWNSTAAQVSIAYNTMIRRWCRENGVRFADAEAVQVAINGGTVGDPVSGYKVADGIHDAQTGAIVRGLAMLDAVRDLLPTMPANVGNPLDVYNVSTNPTGNLLSNGLFSGTSGTSSGTGASGTSGVATGWVNQVVSGTCTCVASKINPRDDGGIGDWQVQTISTTTASTTRLAMTPSITTTGLLAAGDTVQGSVDVEVTASSGTVEFFQLNLFDFDGTANGGSSLAGRNTFGSGLNPLPVLPIVSNRSGANLLTALRGRLLTAPVTIGQGITSTTLLYRLETSLGATSGLTVRWGNADLWRVLPQ